MSAESKAAEDEREDLLLWKAARASAGVEARFTTGTMLIWVAATIVAVGAAIAWLSESPLPSIIGMVAGAVVMAVSFAVLHSSAKAARVFLDAWATTPDSINAAVVQLRMLTGRDELAETLVRWRDEFPIEEKR